MYDYFVFSYIPTIWHEVECTSCTIVRKYEYNVAILYQIINGFENRLD